MEKTRATQIEALREQFGKHGVRKVKLGGFDVDGILRGKYLSLDKFWGAAEGGLGFCDVIFGWDLGDQLYDNATVTGWHTGYPDTRATVDLATFRMIPWEPGTFWNVNLPHPEPGAPDHPSAPTRRACRFHIRFAALHDSHNAFVCPAS